MLIFGCVWHAYTCVVSQNIVPLSSCILALGDHHTFPLCPTVVCEGGMHLSCQKKGEVAAGTKGRRNILLVVRLVDHQSHNKNCLSFSNLYGVRGGRLRGHSGKKTSQSEYIFSN